MCVHERPREKEESLGGRAVCKEHEMNSWRNKTDFVLHGREEGLSPGAVWLAALLPASPGLMFRARNVAI